MIRLFPQGLPPVEAAMEEIIGFLRALAAGNKALTDTIVAYLEFLEARILELQALIMRIQALLNLILSIDVPKTGGLVISGAGTDSVLSGLVTAQNKPVDSPDSYGVGVVLLAGGVPTSLLEILQLLFVEE